MKYKPLVSHHCKFCRSSLAANYLKRNRFGKRYSHKTGELIQDNPVPDWAGEFWVLSGDKYKYLHKHNGNRKLRHLTKLYLKREEYEKLDYFKISGEWI